MADLSKYLNNGKPKKVVAVVTNDSSATVTPSSDQYAGLFAACQDGYGGTPMTLSIGGSDPRESEGGNPWSETVDGGGIAVGGTAFFIGGKGESITYSSQGSSRWRFMAVLMEDA